jgi:hypothetical protein
MYSGLARLSNKFWGNFSKIWVMAVSVRTEAVSLAGLERVSSPTAAYARKMKQNANRILLPIEQLKEIN